MRHALLYIRYFICSCRSGKCAKILMDPMICANVKILNRILVYAHETLSFVLYILWYSRQPGNKHLQLYLSLPWVFFSRFYSIFYLYFLSFTAGWYGYKTTAENYHLLFFFILSTLSIKSLQATKNNGIFFSFLFFPIKIRLFIYADIYEKWESTKTTIREQPIFGCRPSSWFVFINGLKQFSYVIFLLYERHTCHS